MNLTEIIFYFFFGMILVASIMIIFVKKVIYAAFSLIAALLGVAAIYVFARADFIAVTQILIYVGGILILILFGVMLTNKGSSQQVITENHFKFSGTLVGLGMFGLLTYTIVNTNFRNLPWITRALNDQKVITDSTIELIGIKLMSDYVVPFELAAIILLLALIGAAFIAKLQIDNNEF